MDIFNKINNIFFKKKYTFSQGIYVYPLKNDISKIFSENIVMSKKYIYLTFEFLTNSNNYFMPLHYHAITNVMINLL